MTELVITEEMEKLENSALTVYETSKEIEIQNDLQYSHEADHLKGVKGNAKEIETKRKELVKPFQEATKNLNAFFKKPLDLLKNAETNIKRAILAYDAKLEEERIAEQKKIDDLAEKERKRLAKLANKQEAAGNVEKAEETREKAVSVPVQVANKPISIKGISRRDNWIFVITDPDKIPREYMIPDEKKLKQVATAHKGTHPVPGVIFKNEPIIASGT